MEEWLTNLTDSDDDDLKIDSACPLPTFSLTTTVPACATDMTTLQADELQIENDANDQALRAALCQTIATLLIGVWTDTFHGKRETFIGTSGPTFELTDQLQPMDIFYKMIDVDFIDNLCKETNRYAEKKIAYSVSKTKSRKSLGSTVGLRRIETRWVLFWPYSYYKDFTHNLRNSRTFDSTDSG